MKKLIFFVVCMLCALIANAQILVKQNGRVVIGQERSSDDANGVLTLQLMGKITNARKYFYYITKYIRGDAKSLIKRMYTICRFI